jgi:hypothetical protein
MEFSRRILSVGVFLFVLYSCEEQVANKTFKDNNKPSLAMVGEDAGPIDDPDEEPQITLADISPLSDPKIDDDAIELLDKRTAVSKTFLLPNGKQLILIASSQKTKSQNKTDILESSITF